MVAETRGVLGRRWADQNIVPQRLVDGAELSKLLDDRETISTILLPRIGLSLIPGGTHMVPVLKIEQLDKNQKARYLIEIAG